MPNLEQLRAAFALAKVEGVLTNEHRGKYKTELKKLPARLHTSGLGQTVAFYLSAGSEKPEWIICTWLEEWLRGQIYPDQPSLIHSLTQRSEDEYRQASVEARALSIWLKRFAEAFIEGEESD